jgi:DNA-directed RNA polymerase sigma subunit (sigma70/sigma32)
MAIISFRPKQVSKKLLSSLKDRSFDVIANRYGLTDDAERKTLEAIGQKYGITRERVRQIENAALNTIRKSKEMEESKEVFDEVKKLLNGMGAIMTEELEMSDGGAWYKKLELKIENENLVQALKKLKQEYQEIIILRFVDELEMDEIGEIMNKGVVAVRVTLHRALKKLKEIAKQ